MKLPTDYSDLITWAIIVVVLGLIIISIYVSYLNTSQYYQSISNTTDQTEDVDTSEEPDSAPTAKENTPKPKPPSQPIIEPLPTPPIDNSPPWLTGPSDQNTPWGQGPSD